MLKKIMVVLPMVGLVATGVAFSLKASIGLGPFDALVALLSSLVGMQVGTMVIIFNCLMILLQMLLLGKKFKKFQLLQVPLVLVLGNIVNFVLYNLLGDFEPSSYVVRFVLFIAGVTIIASGVGVVMAIDLVPFPIEGACLVFSQKFGGKFSVIRQLADVVVIVLVIAISFILSQDLLIREGTIIGALIFGPIMGKVMNLVTPPLTNYGVIESDTFEELEVPQYNEVTE
ncbi:MAG: hypothetical protein LBV67_11225 [Streptococcaceae bacterium]|jgi:uncharacterized membrane protein YczE|nr:hypothetical protein [Streptococcaceae bacterium]